VTATKHFTVITENVQALQWYTLAKRQQHTNLHTTTSLSLTRIETSSWNVDKTSNFTILRACNAQYSIKSPINRLRPWVSEGFFSDGTQKHFLEEPTDGEIAFYPHKSRRKIFSTKKLSYFRMHGGHGPSMAVTLETGAFGDECHREAAQTTWDSAGFRGAQAQCPPPCSYV